MAGRGPAPKDPAKRRSGGGDSAPRTTVLKDGKVRGPLLPAGLSWHPQTRKWWETWRKSPQAATFTDTDWSFLLDTAVLHSAMWEGDAKMAAEVRLRVAKFGATPEDRARLRIDLAVPDRSARFAAPPAGATGTGSVTPINARRQRISSA